MSRRRQIHLPAALVAMAINVASSSAQDRPAPKKVALLAGVNRYDKRGFADRSLHFAERDVEELATLLQQQGCSVRLLKGSAEAAERASKVNIDAALSQVLERCNAQDVVLIALAEHGQQMPLRDAGGAIQKSPDGRELEDAFFCPVDTVKGDAATLVSLTGLMQTLDQKGGVNFVLVDACRDNPDPGRGTRSITGNELNGRLPSNTAIVFSCAAGQQALETQDAGGGHGVFFYHVLEWLKGEAAKKNGDVTWSSLVEYVRDNTNERAKEWFPSFAERAVDGELQTPHELRNLVRVPVLARAAVASLKPGETVTNSIGMKLVLIPDGEFLMGSPNTEADHESNEGPQHRVRITNSFLLGQYEVTHGEWQTVMGSNPSWFAPTGGGKDSVLGLNTSRFPVEQVSCYGAVEYCNKLSERESLAAYYRTTGIERKDGSINSATVSVVGGNGYGLPTEAEWEYACRAGTTTPFHFGTTSKGREANVNGDIPYGTETKGPFLARTTTVGSYGANTFGLFDMHGNVWEWCGDWYDGTAYGRRAGVTSDPYVQSGTEDRRVGRGGSWLYYPGLTRSAYRLGFTPDFRFTDYGFRLLRTP